MTILTASPRAPIADLLSPQAIAANPVFTRMTADDLQGWAANRIGGGGGAPQPSEPAANPVPTLEPGEDFLVDKKTMASEVLRTNHAMISRLREVTHTQPRSAALRRRSRAQSLARPKYHLPTGERY
jgi:hypothetical protein